MTRESTPKPARLRVLLIEDSAADAQRWLRKLNRAGFEVLADVARVSREFMAFASSDGYDIVLSEYRMPDWTSLEALHWLKSAGHGTPLIVLTNAVEDQLAVECFKAGAVACIRKDQLDRLPVAVQKAVDEEQLRKEGYGAKWRLLELERLYHRTQADLGETREKLQAMLDSTAAAIFGLDREGQCTFCNAGCAQILGYDSPHVLQGRKMHTLIHHTHVDGTPDSDQDCPMLMALRMGAPLRTASDIFWRADGTSFPVEYWSCPVQRSGEVVGCIVTFVDITERVNTEESLRRSEGQFRSMISGAPYGMFRLDESGRVTMANPALAAMLGYASPNEVIGLNLRSAVECNLGTQGTAASANPSGGYRHYETRWKRKDGQALTVRLAERHLVEQMDGSAGLEAFVEDITEQRMLQKQFAHAQKMETAGRLAGGVAHDFNNMLMIIDSYAQLLQECCGDRDKVLEYARKIQDAGSKAAGVSRRLLALSRRHVQETTVFDINHVVQDLGTMLARLLGEDVEITVALEPDPVWVHADRGQIEQVIMNLAVNARDAMPKGGRLSIETSVVQLSGQCPQHDGVEIPPGDYAMLAVGDTGTGMDAETQAHIFEPFFTTKEPGKGTGLGLATVYGFVKQNRGFVWAYSEVGKGSIFRVYLPAVAAPASRTEPAVVRTVDRGAETILLVEDEAALRDVDCVYLESKGYTVLQARNATEAMKICRFHKKPIHLLFTDLVMPGMSGLELARCALELQPGLKILLASGHTDRTPDLETIRSVGTFLQKPFSLDSLARTIRLILQESRGKAEAAG